MRFGQWFPKDLFQISLFFRPCFLPFMSLLNNKLPLTAENIDLLVCFGHALSFYLLFIFHTCRQVPLSDQTNLLHGEQSIIGEEG